MNSQFIDFEGNFGSQDPALQPTEADFAALSEYVKAHRAENEALIETYRREAAKAIPSIVVQEAGQAV